MDTPRIITTTVAPGSPVWRATWRLLRAGEFGGNQHIYLFTRDAIGQPLSRTVAWTWEGRNVSEEASPVRTDMTQTPMGNIPIWLGQKISVWVEGEPSDVVENIHTMHPDASEYGTTGHFAFAVEFRRVTAEKPAPTPPPRPDRPSVDEKTSPTRSEIDALFSDIYRSLNTLHSHFDAMETNQ